MQNSTLLSKRSLKPEKTKMKVSGQFDNLNRARDHAIIRSYIETGKRYGWNIFELCKRALEGHYVILKEMQQKHVMGEHS